MPSPSQTFGHEMEALAARFLQSHGYRIVERGFRRRVGELDLIAQEGETLVFCEVKARRGGGEGSPGEAIGARKQTRMLRAVRYYLQDHPEWEDSAMRFDAVLLQKDGAYWRIELVRDAFRPGW
ncbi:MAG: YraN family protein [Magnetococcales bacterium]|nr:YraN family protein [Magnetococcales bacterium]